MEDPEPSQTGGMAAVATREAEMSYKRWRRDVIIRRRCGTGRLPLRISLGVNQWTLSASLSLRPGQFMHILGQDVVGSSASLTDLGCLL